MSRLDQIQVKYGVSKTCSCGAQYCQVAWESLPFVGVMDDGVERLELRNCPCGSTIALEKKVA